MLRSGALSETFIGDYLDAEWPEVGYTVGVFRLEGRGVQLFDRIEGDHFTILGMPLIPLLGALRERELLARMIRIALTGSIGMGKSTVARMFEAAGVPVFDADAAVRELQGPGGALIEKIGELFPGCVRCGTLDRECLAADRARRSARSSPLLEGIVHPAVREWRETFIAQNRRCARRWSSKFRCCSKLARRRNSTRSSSFRRRPIVQRARVLAARRE